MVTIALLAFALAACGGAVIEGSPMVDAGSTAPDATPDASLDASPEASPDAGNVSEAGDGGCKPSTGHCLTHQTTLCYETTGDPIEEEAECKTTGLYSGWKAGPCEKGERSNGGCKLGCRVEWRYPLGHIPATLASRAIERDSCETDRGGVYLSPE